MTFLVTSCNVSQFLSADERFLKKESLEIDGRLDKDERKKITDNLLLQIDQEPFKRLPAYTYFKNEGKIDSSGKQPWFYRLVAQQPRYFDSISIENRTVSMNNYLKKAGYFDAKVTYETRLKGDKFGSVKYIAHPGEIYRFRDVTYEVQEPQLAQFLAPYWDNSFIKRGEIVSDEVYQFEKNRVSDILYNSGFYYFDKSLIRPLIADSVGHQVDAVFRLNRTENPTAIQRYKVGRINIRSDYDPTYNKLYNLDTTINGYRFLQIEDKFNVKPNTLLRYIYLKQGDYFSKYNYNRTFRQLNRLGLFRYININQTPDDLDSTMLNIDIYLPPYKSLDFSLDFDVNYTNLQASTSRLFSYATQIGTSILKRNLFNGGELLRTSANVGLETSFDSTVFRNEYRLQNTLTVPRFMDYLGIISGLKTIQTKNGPLLGEKFIATLEDRVTTNIGLDFEYVFFRQWYKYFNFNGTYGFDIVQDNEHQYRWNHFGINYFNPTVFSRYSEILARNRFLEESFINPRLFSGFLFRDLFFLYKTIPDNLGNYEFFNTYAELSGFEMNIFNNIFSPNKEWKLFGSTEFSKFFKLYVEGGFNKHLFNKVFYAAKLNLGVGRPFGTSLAVPYLKQFEIGGPSSIRAFPIRKLGPGSYIDAFQQEHFPRGPFYQTGDLKVEYVSELRFDLFYILKGAIFLDAGNIWSLNRNDDRIGARFIWKERPWNQVAVGSGVGLRADFEFFVFRLDVGTIVKNPYKIESSYNPYTSFSDRLRRLEYNLALNYPF